MNRDNESNNTLNSINDFIMVIKPMTWVASVSRYDINNDVLDLSLLNQDDDNNNNIHNHGDDEVYTNKAIFQVLVPMLNDIGTSIQ